jgi:hypothetical protein
MSPGGVTSFPPVPPGAVVAVAHGLDDAVAPEPVVDDAEGAVVLEGALALLGPAPPDEHAAINTAATGTLATARTR